MIIPDPGSGFSIPDLDFSIPDPEMGITKNKNP
jgi:hypothetical protein